jgi:F-type H+-transporting ATPase subunit a
MYSWNLLLTHWLNLLFATPIDAVLRMVGIHPANPQAPIDNRLALEIFVFACLIAFFAYVRLTLSVEKPGPVQHVAETVHEFVESQASQVMGHGYSAHMPLLTALLFFILLCNLLGLLPGISTPTATTAVPLGLAFFTWFYYHWFGVRSQGPIGYLRHFMGPFWWLAWLMFPLEIVSHLARILSLTVRLYANMFASDLITLVFFSGLPFLLPIFGLGLHFLVALIQTYVFMMLAAIYLAEATSTHEAPDL